MAMDEFRALCKAFSLEELAQAGGGNVSVKLGGDLALIKGSGSSLSAPTAVLYRLSTGEAVLGGTPSMEAPFHSRFRTYTVHLHPTAMLPFLTSPDCPGVPYCMPGPALAEQIPAQAYLQPVVFLRNHGVIFSADTVQELLDIASETYERFRTPAYVPLRLYWDVQAQFPDEVVYRVNPTESAAYIPILRRQNIQNLTPDIALYTYNRVHLQDGYLFLHAPTREACLATLEVLRSYCEQVDFCLQRLTEHQVAEVLQSQREQARLSYRLHPHDLEAPPNRTLASPADPEALERQDTA
jgi:hypothetical protein